MPPVEPGLQLSQYRIVDRLGAGSVDHPAADEGAIRGAVAESRRPGNGGREHRADHGQSENGVTLAHGASPLVLRAIACEGNYVVNVRRVSGRAGWNPVGFPRFTVLTTSHPESARLSARPPQRRSGERGSHRVAPGRTVHR